MNDLWFDGNPHILSDCIKPNEDSVSLVYTQRPYVCDIKLFICSSVSFILWLEVEVEFNSTLPILCLYILYIYKYYIYIIKYTYRELLQKIYIYTINYIYIIYQMIYQG